MPFISVCSLSRVHATVARLNPWGLISLLDPSSMIDTPVGVSPTTHLKLGLNDTTSSQEGLISPAAAHVCAILDHIQAWDQAAPLVVHCWAGVSRSTATAFIVACALNPDIEPHIIASFIREFSPTASPNRLLTACGDDLLCRGGKMVEAVDAIGRGEDCFEGVAFDLPARWEV
ncbi:tyrosine phosphatase family protein [Candidatus Phycosocius spiralis]|uniref:Protein-tyrosine-phosphatase n=1 Tax=Candidatus Phycosocius spiralis TaxID=2815099 RepID=A0ABQ4PST8_9PROT|nr:hypothetical protein [Candidatus Phycosocius spiralis]GIU66067.1 protein-tyrosine-phosphatase [Candidatus Phycosocius spiralis]